MKIQGTAGNIFSGTNISAKKPKLTAAAPKKIKADKNEGSDKILSLFEGEQDKRDKLNEMYERLKSASSGMPGPDEVTKTYKRQLLNGLCNTIKLLTGEMYTKKSWAKCMEAYKRALVAVAKKDATIKDLDRAISLLRGGLAKLETAMPEDERGNSDDKKRAETEAAQQGIAEQSKAEAEALVESAQAGVSAQNTQADCVTAE